MRVRLNGELRETAAGSVTELLGEVWVDAAHVIVEVNRVIVTRQAYETTSLTEDAQIEIIRFVSGG